MLNLDIPSEQTTQLHPAKTPTILEFLCGWCTTLSRSQLGAKSRVGGVRSAGSCRPYSTGCGRDLRVSVRLDRKAEDRFSGFGRAPWDKSTWLKSTYNHTRPKHQPSLEFLVVGAQLSAGAGEGRTPCRWLLGRVISSALQHGLWSRLTGLVRLDHKSEDRLSGFGRASWDEST